MPEGSVALPSRDRGRRCRRGVERFWQRLIVLRPWGA
jgi:hypothetical protein